MMIPDGEWLKVLSYRDFYDVPRLMLVKGKDACYWLLDSRFDEELDEYSSSYKIFFLGEDAENATHQFEEFSEGEIGSAVAIEPVRNFRFDETKRGHVLFSSFGSG